MRTTWNGSVSFGLVNIPVGLSPATKPAARQSDVSFRLLHRECGTPIKQKRWCPVHERDHAGIDESVAASDVRAPELNSAKQMSYSLAGPFEPTELRSEYRESLREMLEAKLQGVELEAPVEATPAPVVDLMEALKASVAAASKKEPAAAKKKAAPRKRAAASK